MFSFGFYNSKNQDRMYNAMHLGKIFDGVIQDGIFGTIHENNKTGFQLEPTETPSMNVKINKGKAWLAHTWNLLDSAGVLTFDNASPNMKRTDAVCIEVNNNYSESEFMPRTNRLIVVKNESTVPVTGDNVKPDLSSLQLKNSAGEVIIWRYPLAYVTIYGSDYPASGSGSVTQYHANVIEGVNIESAIQPPSPVENDKYKTWTPLVTGATMDATDYVPSTEDFEAAFNSMLNNDQAHFNSWFFDLSTSLVGEFVQLGAGESFLPYITYYEKINNEYVVTTDPTPDPNKTYYYLNSAQSIYELNNKIDNKILYGTTEPTTLNVGQVYFMIEE